MGRYISLFAILCILFSINIVLAGEDKVLLENSEYLGVFQQEDSDDNYFDHSISEHPVDHSLRCV